MELTNLHQEFNSRFNKDAENAYFCPGRVNLIGEHIDYNGGLVMPCAVTMGTYLLMAPNNDNIIRFRSINFTDELDIPIANNYLKNGSNWYNYPLGVLAYFAQNGYILNSGWDLLYYGNLPISSGLSSSASIEMVTAFAFNEALKIGYSKLDLVKLTKRVENEYIGVNSGIMDQFAVAFGERNKALILNCNTLAYQAVDTMLGNYVLAIINTNKPRKLSESKYNERVHECELALTALQKQLPIKYLCDIDGQTLHQHRYLITDEVVWKRALHVIEENDRVKKAAEVLSQGDIKAFGKLMNESHQSLKMLYEVSGKELDTVAEYSQHYKGVIGARMTGAGFGGCAIALVESDSLDQFIIDITAYYTETIGYAPAVYKSTIGDGVGKVVVNNYHTI
jgi:galactokinase